MIERASLHRRRILVTRAADDAAEWAARLAALGATPIVLPCLTTQLIDDATTRSALARALDVADWIVLTSPRGVAALASLYGATLPPRVSVAAVGPTTARACRERLGRIAFVPTEPTAAGVGRDLAAAIGGADAGRQRQVLVVGAVCGRTDADDELAAAGAAVSRVDVYRTIPEPVAATKRDLTEDNVDEVWLASPSAVKGLINCARVPRLSRVITIGPSTTAAAVAAGLTVSAEASQPTFEAIFEAMSAVAT